MITLQIRRTPTSCIGAADGTARVTASGGVAPYTYQWDDFHSQTTALATGLEALDYTVYVKDSAGELVSALVSIGSEAVECGEARVPVIFPGDTIAFSKTRNRWITRYSFNPEYFGAIRNEIVSFKDGELYLHGAGALYDNFYDVQYSSTVTVVTNKTLLKVKYMMALATSSNSAWGAPAMDIVPSAMYPTGMHTELDASNFRVVQGKYYSEIMRDMNTPGFPTQNDALINGRPMTGQAMSITLENTDTTEATLLAIEIVYSYSEKS